MGKFNKCIPSRFPIFKPINKSSALGITHNEETEVFKQKTVFENTLDKFEYLENILIRREKANDPNSKFLTPVEVWLIKRKSGNQDFKHIIIKKMM